MPTSKRQSAYLYLIAICVLWPSGRTLARPVDEPTEVRRARRMVESEKELILFFAHPTATFQSLRFDGSKKVKDGHSITYTFNWKGFDDTEGYSELTFECDKNGKLDFIRVGDSSAIFFKPFKASSTIIDLLKRELQKDPKLQEDRALMKLLDKNSKAILETYLRRDLEALMTLVRPLATRGR